MQEVGNLLDMIGAYLEQVKLIKAQPVVDEVLLDNVLWKTLDLAIKLNDTYENIYRDELNKLEAIETITIRDELLKRERILELSQTRESVLSNLFDKNDLEELKLYELFEDIMKEEGYETTFHQSDLQLVAEQLELVEENKKKEQLLQEEISNNNKRIEAIENNMKTFEEFNNQLNEEYESFIKINEIDKIDVNAAEITKLTELERFSIFETNMRLMETAVDFDTSKLNHTAQRYERSKVIIEEANELLFMHDLSTIMRKEVSNYDELAHKVSEIADFVETRETNLLSRFPNINYPNDFSYRTMFFVNDLKKVKDQMNYSNELAELTNRNAEIEKELETLYENVKGRRELNDIISNSNNIEPKIEDDIDLEKTEQENVDNAEQEIEEDIYEVINVEQAKPGLLNKLKQHKNKLISFCKKAAFVIIAGVVMLSAKNISNEKAIPKEIAQEIQEIGSELTDDGAASVDELLSMIEEVEQKNHEAMHSIGDKVNLSEGVTYYKDAVSAQLTNNPFVVGKNGLRAEDYNVNRIAIMEKDENGKATGKILAINTTPGVSAEELASSIGLKEGQYDVMIHISSGDSAGNYIEANINRPSPDDLCWLKGDEQGISLVSPASEILKENERGITR